MINPRSKSAQSWECLPAPIEAYDIPTFCASHSISRAFLYKLWKEGIGPRTIKLGRRTLISKEAAAEWRVSREEGGK